MKFDIEWLVDDGGVEVGRVILHMPEEVKMADVQGDKFSVYVERRDPFTKELVYGKIRWDRPGSVWSRGYRTITAAYPSDAKGNPLRKGSFVTLELDVNDAQSRALLGTLHGNTFADITYRITQIGEIGTLAGLVFDEQGEIYCPQTERYVSSVSSYEPLPLQYSYFTPEDAESEKPLIIWLHGAGEGGEDPRISYMGNNVPALSSDEIQAFFGGAYVLVPTSPTMWMDDGSHEYHNEGKSMYAEAMFALIEEFVAAHPIDKKRIYIGGCSNGGFMTMRMIIDHPDYFAAAYPWCEALYADTISDEDIEKIKNVPIWFLHAMTDSVVNPTTTAVPTYHRLMAAGAPDVHFTYLNDKYPFNEAVDHNCWPIGFANAENYDFDHRPVLLNGVPTTRFEWLAAKHK